MVLSPPGTFPKLEAGSPTRPDLNLQVSRRLRKPPPKLKSAVKSVHLNLPKPEDLEGPASRSRYDDSAMDDQPWRDKSRHHSEAHNRSRPKSSGHSARGSGRHDRRSGQSFSKHYPEESLGAKLIAHKEHEKWYKKIVDNPMLYLEECQHQILPEEHQLEIHSLRFL